MIQTVEKSGIEIPVVNKLKDFDCIEKNDLQFIEEFMKRAKTENTLLLFYMKARMLVQDNTVMKSFFFYFN